jgi:hypothetical protein
MSYAIPDEPVKTRLGHLVVQPSAPLLAAMLCGAWMAWPWFVLNTIAMGSPTRRKEIALCAIGFGGTTVLAIVLVVLHRAGVIEGVTAIRLALLVVSSWKLAVAYAVSSLQGRTFHVYRYYGGAVRDASRILIAGMVLRGVVLGLVDSDLWVIILRGGL